MSVNTHVAIVIPARFGSTRFEGKPLAKIGSRTMLQHSCQTALQAATLLRHSGCQHVQVIVATESQAIFDHATSIASVTPVITPETCPTGSDRVLLALEQLKCEPEVVINLQGDAPFTPPYFVSEIAKALLQQVDCSVATPAVALTWKDLDQLRENKKTTPFSGTTVVFNQQHQALWFSKNIIPAIRNEEKYRKQSKLSPVYQHIGLYGFRLNALKKFVTLDSSHYENIEGLEQLRLLENNMPIYVAPVSYGDCPVFPGIDTKEDLERTEVLLRKMGELS